MNEQLAYQITDKLIQEAKFTINGTMVNEDHRSYIFNLVIFFLQTVNELGLIILPQSAKADYGQVRQLEQLMHDINLKRNELDPSDFNAADLLSYMASSGWIVIPPR